MLQGLLRRVDDLKCVTKWVCCGSDSVIGPDGTTMGEQQQQLVTTELCTRNCDTTNPLRHPSPVHCPSRVVAPVLRSSSQQFPSPALRSAGSQLTVSGAIE